MRFVPRRFSRRLLLTFSAAFAGIVCIADESKSAEATSRQQVSTSDERPTLAEVRAAGVERSRFKRIATERDDQTRNPAHPEPPRANLSDFESTIEPLLAQHCVDCHGPDATEGNLRIDTLDPNLLTGPDADWWAEAMAVITKGEMPPPDSNEIKDDDRREIIDWLAGELQAASIVRRQSEGRSAYRRMTRYEYNYALQDLLGLPWDFARDLPPESQSDDGFENSSNLLHLTVSQFETFREIARQALKRATVSGDQPPTLYWSIPMKHAASREWSKQDQALDKLKKELEDDPDKLASEVAELKAKFGKQPRGAYYKDLTNGRMAEAEWKYHRAAYAFAPSEQRTPIGEPGDTVAVLPAGRNSRLIVELGDQLPDEGTMRVTAHAARVDTAANRFPSLQLMFGWQASNEGRASRIVSEEDTPITAGVEQPQLIQWDVPLGEIYPRNSVRKTSTMGTIPSPSEYVRLVNSSAAPAEIQIDWVQVAAPVHDQWPPASHRRIFFKSDNRADEAAYAREVIAAFMHRAWRRPITVSEIDRKLALLANVRPQCDSLEEAIVEVLASVLSSPQFLYVVAGATEDSEPATQNRHPLDSYALANRLSLFLWCSLPDNELLTLAESGKLLDDDVLMSQVERMLDDPRSERFAENFVHQWLDLQLLEFLNLKRGTRGFDVSLKAAMQREPVEFFSQIMAENASVLDFLHSDYAVVNERLAQHYGMSNVYGNHFRRVELDVDFRRGGLLTQAGLLTMNSSWPDSHPLKRAIWLLECILADPPPPPPPAVPQIDLADPEIAKMTLKERIEDHRNHAACMSCHSKIDPWGIAFENYDALGGWRDKIKGKPVEATSELFNGQPLDGMDGLKRFLLEHRQDQFVRALVTKLTTYALGRSLTFSDRADIDAITANVRRNGDGLRTTISAIVRSDLFRSR